jgi:hypothetical protein
MDKVNKNAFVWVAGCRNSDAKILIGGDIWRLVHARLLLVVRSDMEEPHSCSNVEHGTAAAAAVAVVCDPSVVCLQIGNYLMLIGKIAVSLAVTCLAALVFNNSTYYQENLYSTLLPLAVRTCLAATAHAIHAI